MGRAALLMVIGLGLAFGYIGYNIRSSGNATVETQMGYLKYTTARNLARTAVHAALRSFDKNEMPPTSQVEFNGGTYRIPYTAENGDTLWLTTAGTYAESSYTMNVTLIRDTKPFPGVNAAIGIRASPVSFTLSGAKTEVDGRNYTADGTALVGSGDVTGVATMNGGDSTTVANESSGRVKGDPPVKVDTTTANPADYIDEYIANADYVFNTPGVIAGNYKFGTASQPVIVVCNAGADTNFSIKFTGKIEGYGILAVRGNVQLNGGFAWHGLVVAFGEQNIVEFGAAGTPQVVGGLIVAGDRAASLTLRGSGSVGAKVKYSEEALAKARNIGKLRYYRILSWYER